MISIFIFKINIMSKLSGIRDLDREILGKLHDKEILIACSIDKYTWNTVCDDAFLKRRLLMKYPKIEKEKYEAETWKRFFLRAVNYISLLKERYGYDYTFGNFVTQYICFTKCYDMLDDEDLKYKYHLLIKKSAKRGELALVIWSLKNGACIHYYNDRPVRWACKNGHLEVVKYLAENGANIHSSGDAALSWAFKNGHLEVVKYLLENENLKDDFIDVCRQLKMLGANNETEANNETGANNINSTLRGCGYLEMIHYIEGAKIHADSAFSLRCGIIVDYLKTKFLNEI